MLQFDFLLPLLPLLPWIIILIAWGILFALDASIQLKKHGIEVGPFMVMIRTKRLNNGLDRIGRWHPRAWRYLYSGFVGVCFAFALVALYLLFLNLIEFIRFFMKAEGAAPGAVVPLVPGITIGFSTFAMLIVPLIITIVFHEFAHGISARADDIPVRSSGVFALLILFGAFVEPDEEYVKVKATRKARVRLYAAGSGANLGLALVGILLATLLVAPVPRGVLIRGTVPGSAADGVLAPWTVITGMNDTTIATREDLAAFMRGASPGDLIELTVNGAKVNLTVGADPDNASQAFIGIYLTTYYPLVPPLDGLGPATGFGFQQGLSWFFTITFSVGLLNLLPTPPLDGDKLFKELIDALVSLERRRGRALLWGLRGFALGLLILNVVFTILTPGLILSFFT